MIKLVPMSEIDRMCCVDYEIVMTGDYTVSTFVLEILNSFKRNWGYIFLYDTDNRDKPALTWQYKNELLTEEIAEEWLRSNNDIRRCKVVAAQCYGGYCNMDYRIYYRR